VKFHGPHGHRPEQWQKKKTCCSRAEQILADQLEDLMDHMVDLKQQLMTSPQQ